MDLVIDSDVERVIEFMQTSIPASRLVAVAQGIASLAPILWGEFQPEQVQTLRLEYQPPIFSELPTQAIASE